MSAIASVAAASAASPIVDLFNHVHRKGGHAASSTDAGATSSTQGPATNHRLFSSLLESLEQVIGVSLTAPTSAAPVTTAAASAAAMAAGIAAPGATGGVHLSSSLGANINAKV